jgi:hypothetical protein
MNLNDLFRLKDIDPQHVLVLRHRPRELQLNKILPLLAAEEPNLFNAYQQSQSEKVEQAMTHAQYIASFIGHEPGKALFVGLYLVKGSKLITREQFWEISENIKLKSLGMNGFTEESPRSSCLWFDLMLTDFYPYWKGKLVIRWPGLELAWFRWAHKPKNEMPVLAILEECALEAAMPIWDEIQFSWEQLDVLPSRLKSKLEEWRGIYYIFDISDGKGYVGSAYSKDNIYGRWKYYAKSGHGGNRLLKQRDPHNFRFSILQRVSPDMDCDDVIGLETSWKRRLHTRNPYGLNDN